MKQEEESKRGLKKLTEDKPIMIGGDSCPHCGFEGGHYPDCFCNEVITRKAMQTEELKMDTVTILDDISIRGQCEYLVFEDQPKEGRWWAVKLVPTDFPEGLVNEKTGNGLPVERCVVVIAELNHEDKWVWSHSSFNAKMFFGNLLFDDDLFQDRWYFIQEIDGKRGESP